MNKRSLFLVLVVVVGFFMAARNILDHLGKKNQSRPPEDLASQSAPTVYPLKPANPEEYGMVVWDSPYKITSQEDADRFVGTKIQEIKKQLPAEALAKMKQEINTDQADMREKLLKIDSEIEKCRGALRQDPYNEAAKNKLQNLLILKSIAHELPL